LRATETALLANDLELLRRAIDDQRDGLAREAGV
jgi:hypothetical protein